MNQAIIVNTYIYKGAKFGDISNDAWHHHTLLQILNGLDARIKLKLLYLSTRIQTRFVKLSHNIRQGRHTHLSCHIFLDINFLLQILIFHQLLHGNTLIFRHLFYQGITLWVNGTVVQRILGSRNTKETCTLLESRRSQTRHLLQLRTGSESSILLTIFYNILGKSRTKTTHVGQEMLGCSIQVYTYRVHTTHHHGIQALLKLSLVHIMLILSYTDALRINLHQFGKRIHQSSADTYGTTYGNILIREFISGNLGCRIDRSTILAYYIDIHRVWITYFVQPVTRLATCSTISYSHRLYLIHLHHTLDSSSSLTFLIARRMRINDFMMNQIALCIETAGLATIGKTRIHRHHSLLT